MQELGKLNLFARNIPYERMGLCIHSHPCLHRRSYLQNTPSNYCLAYQAGSRSAHSIWPLSWQRPNGRGFNEKVSGLSSQVGLSVILLLAPIQRMRGRWAVESLRRPKWEREGEERGRMSKRGRRRREGSERGEPSLESTWSVIQGRKRRWRAIRSCNNTVWQSEGELLDSQHTVYT